MIEKGRFYRAGLMKDIDPGHTNSTVPYYIKVKAGDTIAALTDREDLSPELLEGPLIELT